MLQARATERKYNCVLNFFYKWYIHVHLNLVKKNREYIYDQKKIHKLLQNENCVHIMKQIYVIFIDLVMKITSFAHIQGK